jgi:hypothetical protein
MAENKPGQGFLGWLGRQVGHLTKAAKTDVAAKQVVVHRDQKVQEAELPGQPNVTLRRTTIDEVIVDRPPQIDKEKEPRMNADERR